MPTNFQIYLENLYESRSTNWKAELKDLDMAGDYEVADAEEFLASLTRKNTAQWAIGVELKARHGALKKIIESV